MRLVILHALCVNLRRGGGIENPSFGYDYTWQGGGADANLNIDANWVGGASPFFFNSTSPISRCTTACDLYVPSGLESQAGGLVLYNGASFYLNGNLRLDSTTHTTGFTTTYGLWMENGGKLIQSENTTGDLIIKPDGGHMNQVTLRNGGCQLVFWRGEIVTPWLTVGGDQERGNGELFQQYGGEIEATSFYVGNNGTGTFEQYGGTVTATTSYFGSGKDRNGTSRTGTGTIHLHGGTFHTENLRGNVDANTEIFLHVGETSFGTLNITGSSNYTGKISVGLEKGVVSWQGEEDLTQVPFLNHSGTTDGKEIFQTSDLFAIHENQTITLNSDKNMGQYTIGSDFLNWKESQTGFVNIVGSEDPYTLTLQVGGVEDMADFLAWLNTGAEEVTASASGSNAIMFSTFASGLNQTFLFDFTPYTRSDVYAVGLGGNPVPEPASWLLLCLGLVFWARKKGGWNG